MQAFRKAMKMGCLVSFLKADLFPFIPTTEAAEEGKAKMPVLIAPFMFL